MRTVRLGEIATSVNGRAFKPSEWSDVGVPIIRIENLNDATAPFHRFQGVIDPKHVVADGDLLVSWSASLDAYIWERGHAVVNQHIFKVSEDSEVVDRRFFYFALKAAMSDIRSRVHGATMRHVTKGEFESVLLQIPPLAEQRRIAEQLTEQLAEVANARAVSRSRLKEIPVLVRSELRWALELNTKEWPSVRLGNVANIQLGKMLSPASRTGSRPIPYLRNANVQWDRFVLADVSEMDFDQREETKFQLRRGDVLVCEGGEPGRAAVWNGQIDRCCYQKSLHRLRPIDDAVDPQFLVYRLWLGAGRSEFTSDHAKTTIAHLPAVRLATLTISLPDIATQRRIAAELRERLATIDAMAQSLNAERAAIEALSVALLHRATHDVAA